MSVFRKEGAWPDARTCHRFDDTDHLLELRALAESIEADLQQATRNGGDRQGHTMLHAEHDRLIHILHLKRQRELGRWLSLRDIGQHDLRGVVAPSGVI